jgi:hypothetical protein
MLLYWSATNQLWLAICLQNQAVNVNIKPATRTHLMGAENV